MVTMNTAMNYLKMYPEFVFGTGYEAFSNKFKETWNVSGNLQAPIKDRLKWSFGDAFEATVKHNEKQIADNGGSFWKATKKSLTSIWPDLKDNWKLAGETAEAASKSKFLAKLKSVGKVFGKRMPLIGALITLAVEAPNIFKATKEEGVLTGAGETAKTAGRLGLSTLLGAITQALIPIPLLGGAIGFVGGDMLGRFIFGKTYTEKQAKNQDNKSSTDIPQMDFSNIKIPYGGNTALNDAEFMKLEQMYNQAANATGLNSTNPFMQTMPHTINQNNFSTLP